MPRNGSTPNLSEYAGLWGWQEWSQELLQQDFANGVLNEWPYSLAQGLVWYSSVGSHYVSPNPMVLLLDPSVRSLSWVTPPVWLLDSRHCYARIYKDWALGSEGLCGRCPLVLWRVLRTHFLLSLAMDFPVALDSLKWAPEECGNWLN